VHQGVQQQSSCRGQGSIRTCGPQILRVCQMIPLSLIAGFAQAGGSTVGKLAFGADSLLPRVGYDTCASILASPESNVCLLVSYAIRGLLTVAMFTLNSYGA
jgi:hypothetical protein